VDNSAQQVCFPETGKCVRGPFLAYWQQHGGLAVNGYPLSDERIERLEDGRFYQVQYFERVRLEYHPENTAPYDILLGQFGRHIFLERRGRDADPAAQPIAGQVYFSETGHNLGSGFLAYWQTNGGLAQFGYPLSEVFQEQLADGHAYRVQYFERARFEYHPENQPPYGIELGQFGRQILTEMSR
jgi:polysaccharide biosynthesis protein PslG